jgi:hypothetical protein
MLGSSSARSLWTALSERFGLAFGLVLGIAVLGALAFTARPDVRVVWFDERGHLAVGMKRTETEQDLQQSTRLLNVERARNQVLEKELRRREATEHRPHDLRPAVPQEKIATEINPVGIHPQSALKVYKYRVARTGDLGFLPLRDRPVRSSGILQLIPAKASEVQSPCNLVVHEDAVFVQAYYHGLRGWVSGYYLEKLR